jgi:nitrate/nitrite-specific signal transduction histidine kinase
LQIMQERAAQVGGHVRFGANGGVGTVVEAILPASVPTKARDVAS